MTNDDLNLDRFSPLDLGRGRRLLNRVVVPPMASGTADKSGFVTTDTIQHYQRLSGSGAGLVMVEYSYVHVSGRSEDQQLGIDSDAQVSGLAQVAETIHRSGAIAGIQLTHSGGKTTTDLTGGVLMGPSAVTVPVKDRQLLPMTPMTQAQIEIWQQSFLAATDRASRAGFDWVELHSAHGYGLNQWISPITNQRVDGFGGSMGNRFRILLELVETIRAKFPHLLMSVRMPGQDFSDGGLTTTDTTALARALVKRGVDVLNISSGIGGWRRPSDRNGEGYLVAEAERIQVEVDVPVIGVGGIKTGDYIDQALRTKQFSLAAVGRAILADPVQWNRQWMRKPAFSLL